MVSIRPAPGKAVIACDPEPRRPMLANGGERSVLAFAVARVFAALFAVGPEAYEFFHRNGNYAAAAGSAGSTLPNNSSAGSTCNQSIAPTHKKATIGINGAL
jgi:hypothetical protein